MHSNGQFGFKGVYLKHLIKGEKTDNQISCHLVKIDPGCEIGLHNHIGKSELHEVLDGSGECITGETKVPYKPGCVALIPADINHKVTAGEKGWYYWLNFSLHCCNFIFKTFDFRYL